MKIPRVTEILNYYTHYDKVPRDILKNAAARGTIVHGICAGIAKGEWIPDSLIDAEYLSYVNSFRQWSEAQVDKYVIIEKRFADEKLNYTGQLDFVVKANDGELYLVDLKTSATHQKTYPIQMGAYNNLLEINNIKVKGAMIVYLKKNGDFPDIEYLDDMIEEFHVFLSALDCWKYFNKGKKDD